MQKLCSYTMSYTIFQNYTVPVDKLKSPLIFYCKSVTKNMKYIIMKLSSASQRFVFHLVRTFCLILHLILIFKFIVGQLS